MFFLERNYFIGCLEDSQKSWMDSAMRVCKLGLFYDFRRRGQLEKHKILNLELGCSIWLIIAACGGFGHYRRNTRTKFYFWALNQEI